MSTVLFRPFFHFDEELMLPLLREVFSDYDFRFYPDFESEDEIDYLILWKLEKGDKHRWPNLKAAMTLSAGVNQYIGHPGMPDVPLYRMIDPTLSAGMAEYIASYVLRLHREHSYYEDLQTKSIWNKRIDRLASDRTIGFMGLGEMATASINALRPYGFNMKGLSKREKQIDGVACFTPANMAAFLKNVDILVCLLPLTDETKHILNTDIFSQLPKGANLINAARGSHLVEKDLLEALDSDHLNHAVLDVFEKEPLQEDHPFWRHPKITITPHVASNVQPLSAAQSAKKVIDALERGETPNGLVDFKAGY